MKLDQTIDPSEIVSPATLAQKFLTASRDDMANASASQEANKHLRMQVAFQGGALMEVVTHKLTLAATAKFQSEWMGMLAAATEPTAQKLPKLEQRLEATAAIPVTTAQRPGVNIRVGYKGPTNG